MRNKALASLLQPNYSPFFFDQSFEDDFRESFFRDFYENDEAYFTGVDVPGVTAEDINIDIEDSYIRVTAERKDSYNRTDSAVKKYNYVINIPKNVDRENISAHYENGVLNLALNKMKVDNSKKKISISTGEKPKSWKNFLGLKKDDPGKVEGSTRPFN